MRGMATLKESKLCVAPIIIKNALFYFLLLPLVSLRLKSIKNIQKITKSMKMVAAAKFGQAEKDLRFTRPYGSAAASRLLDFTPCMCHTCRARIHNVISLNSLF